VQEEEESARPGRHRQRARRTERRTITTTTTNGVTEDDSLRIYEDRRAELEDVWPREPRCRICRDETVRILVNELLDWHGAPIILGGGKTHRITYADILRALNEGRDKRITYDSVNGHR
jgi:hypothetical protein